jgi:hypothetical protein
MPGVVSKYEFGVRKTDEQEWECTRLKTWRASRKPNASKVLRSLTPLRIAMSTDAGTPEQRLAK